LVGTNRMLGLVTASQIASASVTSFFCRLSRVEERRGGTDVLRFLSPLIKPDRQFSRIRLSDQLHHKAHAGDLLRTRFSTSTPGSP
jgi:hypothetical protein